MSVSTFGGLEGANRAHYARQKERLARQYAAGMCSVCDQPRAGDRKKCGEHLLADRRRRAAYYAQNSAMLLEHDRTVYRRTRWAGHIRRTYGLEPADYERMREAQGGLCAICRQPETDIPLSVDHCHTSGRVRGLLCRRCNKTLGLMHDDPSILLAATQYLEGV